MGALLIVLENKKIHKNCYFYNVIFYSKNCLINIMKKKTNIKKRQKQKKQLRINDSPSVSPFGLLALTAAAKQRGQDAVKSSLL